MIKNEWTTEEVLRDVINQLVLFRKNRIELLNNLKRQNIIARTALKKYADTENWIKLGYSKSLYKGHGVKKATTALTRMNKLEKEIIDE